MEKQALIIGASSGLGRCLAEQLAAEGWTVGLAARREPLLREIAAARPEAFWWAAIDVTRPEEAVPALEELSERMGGFDLCIVTAGAGELNPRLDFERECPAVYTNVVGWTAAVDWAWGRLERQGGGHLALVTSVGGLRGSDAAPAYNASKAYQMNYAEGLRRKATKQGCAVVVTDIRPGLVATAMAKGEGLFWVMPPDKAARQMLRALRRRKRMAVVTRRSRIAAWLLRRLPESLYLRM